jgi:transcriptional regulator with XRE-family HTH domain
MTHLARELRTRGVPDYAVDLRKWRRAHRVTLHDLALEAGISPVTLWRIETGSQGGLHKTYEKLRAAQGRLMKRAGRRRAWERRP